VWAKIITYGRLRRQHLLSDLAFSIDSNFIHIVLKMRWTLTNRFVWNLALGMIFGQNRVAFGLKLVRDFRASLSGSLGVDWARLL
jgi:hypothetical protein